MEEKAAWAGVRSSHFVHSQRREVNASAWPDPYNLFDLEHQCIE